MQIHVSQHDTATLLRLAGRMDATTAHLFEESCNDALTKGAKRMVVDMEGIVYISSAGLRSILTVQKTAKDSLCAIAYCALQPMVVDVFRISGFNRILTLCATQEDALAKMP